MAVNALSALGTNAPVPPLVNALRDPERIIASPAATALGNIGRSARLYFANDRSGYCRNSLDERSTQRDRKCKNKVHERAAEHDKKLLPARTQFI